MARWVGLTALCSFLRELGGWLASGALLTEPRQRRWDWMSPRPDYSFADKATSHFKGKIGNRTVAVERMFNTYRYEDMFQQELECLVKGILATYNGKMVMADAREQLLCFEYLPKGSLDKYITGRIMWHWTDCFQIITGICQGLNYLHQKRIVHLDLKPRNILLDDNFVPKIAGFTLSRCVVESEDWVTTSMIGTPEYVPPECFNDTEMTCRYPYDRDIYSVGVTIMEILIGKKGYHDINMVVESWSDMADKSHSDVQMEQVRICAEIAIACIDFNPAKRPDAQHIISRLDQIETMGGYVKTGMITSHQAEDAPNELHLDTPDTPREASSKVLKIGVGAISKRNLKKRKIRAAMENNPHHSAWLKGTREMEEDPITVLLGPSGPLFQKLRSVIASQDSRLKRVKVEIQFLGQGLKGLCNGFNKDLFEAPQDSITRCWMRQVRDLCYDTTDYLDEVMHFIQYSGTGRGKTRLFGGKRLGSKIFRVSCRLTWVSLPKVKKLKRGPMIAKLSALLARVEDADERRERFNISPRETSTHDHSQATSTSVGHLMAQLPIQLHVDNLIRLLALDHDDNVIEKKLKVVTIFGPASADKTAVVRTYYHQYGGKFQYRAFLRVSRDPDMWRLLTDMISQIKAPLTHTISDVQGLTGRITKHLQGKRYLIIIDDLWSTPVWDIIIRALPDGDYCRIIATTQVEDVALACCSYQLKHIYKITPLNDDQSGESEGGCTTYPSSEVMKEALNLVYNNLPPHLKACLLYMNMYPEGYTTRKDELVKQWVAEDFIGSVHGQDRENTAGSYFDALISSGLVQSVDTDHNGEVLSCTLHHMVLDLIRQKSMEENFVTIVNYFQTILGLPDKVRRLSVQLGGAKGANTIQENMRISQVRSLLFSGFFKGVPSIVEYGLLQVLILHIWSDQDMTFDLTSIGELYRLRYLKIECNITVKLPGKIRRLRHLSTLQVDARLSAIPSDIVHLDKLLHLRLRSESILPHGVGHMTSLRTLGYFDLNSNPKINLMGLGKLTNLQNLQLTCSTVQPAENLEKNMQLLGTVLEKLSILQSVTLVPATGSSNVNTLQDDTGASNMIISCDGFSSASPAPAHLRRLKLSRGCCIFSRLPRWVGELAQLRILKIAVKELSKEDTDILKGLPALAVLSLHVMTTSPEMIVFGKGGFSVLIYFKFTCTVPWLKFEENAMPNLQKLRLGFNATTVDKQGIIIEHLSCIKEISAIIGCVSVGAESACQKAIMNDPRNPKVQWMGSIYVGDEGTGHVVTHEAQEYYRAQGKVSGGGEIMDETDGIQDENNEVASKSNPRNQMLQSMGSIYYGGEGREMVTHSGGPRNRPREELSGTMIVQELIIRSVIILKQHSMATSWDVAAAGWAIVLGWLMLPIIAFLLSKILSFLVFDASKKLLELETCIIPELQHTMQAVDQERMIKRSEKLKPDVATLDKMAAMLRHAQEQVEDIFDDAKQKIVSGDILSGAVQTSTGCPRIPDIFLPAFLTLR
uniref:Phytosulfokine receptor 1 n=1 Tax=Aegilops tauschii TaxID=37682 RepID=R7W891_AEGTA